MRKYLDIPLTVIGTCALTVAMLWPLQGAPGPDGSDKVVHLVAFAALAFPLARKAWPRLPQCVHIRWPHRACAAPLRAQRRPQRLGRGLRRGSVRYYTRAGLRAAAQERALTIRAR